MPNPFDQDRPPKRSRPDDDRARRSERPPADASRRRARSKAADELGPGWDDGRGHKTSGGRRPRSDRPAGAGGGLTARLGNLPKWALPAAGVVVVLLLLLIVVKSCSGGSDKSSGGACLTDLMGHLPATATAVYGTDFIQADKAGFTRDGSLEEIGQSLTQTGALPDPVTVEYRVKLLATADELTTRTGMSPDDVDCALSDGSNSVLSGSFDAPEVGGSQAGSDGDLAATDDLLAMAPGAKDPKALLEPAKDDGLAGNEAMVATLEALRDDGAYSVIVQQGDGENNRALAAGIGAGGTGDDDRAVMIAWTFKNDSAAKAGRPDVVNRVNEVLKGTVSIKATDLKIDGDTVTAVIPTRSAPDLQDIVRSRARLVNAPT